MKKSTLIIIIILIVASLWGIVKIFFNSASNDNAKISTIKSNPVDATYEINNQPVTLVNGISESVSDKKIITKYYGGEVSVDLNNDGRSDKAFIVSQQTVDGTFYYLLAVLNTINGQVGSKGLLLGSNISSLAVSAGGSNTLIVKYSSGGSDSQSTNNSNSNSNNSSSTENSIIVILNPDNLQFQTPAQNSTSQTAQTIKDLSAKTWTWVSSTYKEVGPQVIKEFSISFKDDGSFSANTDCNDVSGQYLVNGNNLSLIKMVATMVACDNYHGGDFINMLNDIQTFSFTSKSELILGLKSGDGAMLLK